MKDEVQLKKYLPSLIFAIILPVIAYLFLKMLGNSDTLALGIATAFPVVHMLWSLIRKKRVKSCFFSGNYWFFNFTLSCLFDAWK